MATITWLGEDNLHEGGNGPRFNEWNGVRFEVGKPVDLDNEQLTNEARAHMLKKAKRNVFFEVSGTDDEQQEPRRGPGRPPKAREGEAA